MGEGRWQGVSFDNQVLLLMRQTDLSPGQGMGNEDKGVEVVTEEKTVTWELYGV